MKKKEEGRLKIKNCVKKQKQLKKKEYFLKLKLNDSD